MVTEAVRLEEHEEAMMEAAEMEVQAAASAQQLDMPSTNRTLLVPVLKPPTGSAVKTTAGSLEADAIIHAVAPDVELTYGRYRSSTGPEDLLRAAYGSSFKAASGLECVACPASAETCASYVAREIAPSASSLSSTFSPRTGVESTCCGPTARASSGLNSPPSGRIFALRRPRASAPKSMLVATSMVMAAMNSEALGRCRSPSRGRARRGLAG